RETHALAPCAHGWELPFVERCARARRPRRQRHSQSRRRRVAGRCGRALDEPRHRQARRAEARGRIEMTPALRAAIAALTLTLCASSSAAQPLRAAAVKVDITPKTPQWLLGYQARQSD